MLDLHTLIRPAFGLSKTHPFRNRSPWLSGKSPVCGEETVFYSEWMPKIASVNISTPGFRRHTYSDLGSADFKTARERNQKLFQDALLFKRRTLLKYHKNQTKHRNILL